MQTTFHGAKPKNQFDLTAFSGEEKQQIRTAIQHKYASVASSASGYFKYAVGKEGAQLLGYSKEILDVIPDNLLNSFCGVGNPFTIAPLKNGDNVLDIGCGAGFDLIVASRLVGSAGRVYGVDLTPEMLTRAEKNLDSLNIDNVEVMPLSSELLPFPDNTFDVVISNGVINLSPAKPQLFTEIYRVLKPGGRLQFADIILERELPAHLAASVESWSQ